MEELRSTEVLDREILEDARKKAHKILKTADDTLASQTRSWDRKIKKSLDSLRKTYEDRTKRSTGEILAKVPLDKRRLRSETSEALLAKAMDDFLLGLPRERLLSILKIELSRRLEALAGDEISSTEMKPTLLCSCLGVSEARLILESSALNSGDWEIKEGPSGRNKFPAIVINTPYQKITASVEDAARELMKDKRAELASALLGKGVLND